jgi:hypothetical protein
VIRKKIKLIASFIDLSGNVDCVKGGGPYGSEVTRGQDLTGKDFSGRTLIKQDFKTVYTLVLFLLSFFLSLFYICIFKV